MLCEKGTFTYDYFDSVENLAKTQLPNVQNFHNKLNDLDIRIDDYVYAHRMVQYGVFFLYYHPKIYEDGYSITCPYGLHSAYSFTLTARK